MLKNQHVLWKDTYTNEKDNIENLQKKFIYNFNISNEYAINEWENLQSQIQKYSNTHEIYGWENIHLDKIIIVTTNPKIIIINGITIHFALAMTLNKTFNELKTTKRWKKHDSLIKTYDQLWLLIIDEISLVGNIILIFFNHKLRIVKQLTINLWVVLMLLWWKIFFIKFL